MSGLTREKALIFRITHIDNIPWIIEHGIHCRNSETFDPNYVNIGNEEIINRRAVRQVPIHPGGVLSDYVPFYFTPFSPMLLNIKTGWQGLHQRPMSEIVICVTSLHLLAEQEIPFVFTDRHAGLEVAQFFDNLDSLSEIDWNILRNQDFKRDPNDLGKVERYQAEALIHNQLPLNSLKGFVCYGSEQKAQLESEMGDCGAKILVKPSWYFQ